MRISLVICLLIGLTNCGNIAQVVSSRGVLPSNDPDLTFFPSNIVDGDITTCWQDSSRGSGVGEWIEIQFKSPEDISAVNIANGFQRTDPKYGDLYWLNNRVQSGRLCTQLGQCVSFELPDARQVTQVPFPAHSVLRLRLTILSTYKGSRWQDTSISEVSIVEPGLGISRYVVFFLFLIGFLILLRNRKKLQSLFLTNKIFQAGSSAPMAAPQDSFQINKKKGDAFENYVAELFLARGNLFSIVRWNTDHSDKRKGLHVESDRDPDIQFRFNPEQQIFAVECKWRQNLAKVEGHAEPCFTIKPSHIVRYRKFADAEGCPVFLVLGLGGSAKSPKRLFCLPLTEIQYPNIYARVLDRYERLSTKPFYWEKGALS